MDISKFFETLAQYLNFFLDFLLLRGFERYGRLGSISPELVSYFIVGVFAAYVISSIKRMPGYERLQVSEESTANSEARQITVVKTSGDSEDDFKMDMAGFVLLSIVVGIFFHAFLVVYNKIFPVTEIGNIKDSLNAIFAVNAMYNPLNAILKQIQRGAKLLATVAPSCALVGAGLLLTLSGVYFFSIYYWIYAFAAVHGTSRKYMMGPMAIVVALGLVLGIVVFITQRASKRTAQGTVPPATPAESEVVPDTLQTPGN